MRAQTATRAEPAAVTGEAGPVRMYRQTSRGVTQSQRSGPTLTRRKIPWRAVLLTGAAAFAIAIAAITVIDLASSGSVNTTPLGRSSNAGSRTNDSTDQKQGDQQEAPQNQQSTTTDETPTTTEPAQQPQSDTAPATPPTTTAPVDPNATP